jgi:hypothetical protein
LNHGPAKITFPRGRKEEISSKGEAREIPNTKYQTKKTSFRGLRFEDWNLFGIWNLGFEI